MKFRTYLSALAQSWSRWVLGHEAQSRRSNTTGHRLLWVLPATWATISRNIHDIITVGLASPSVDGALLKSLPRPYASLPRCHEISCDSSNHSLLVSNIRLAETCLYLDWFKRKTSSCNKGAKIGNREQNVSTFSLPFSLFMSLCMSTWPLG